MYRINKCLITGASGFIGRHLIKNLVKKGYIVDGVVHTSTFDLTNYKSIIKYINNKHYDYIFHLAASPPGKDDVREEEFLTNVVGTYNLIRALRGSNFQGFINIGTSLEYGLSKTPMREDMAPVPTFLHGGTKAAATMIATSMAFQYNLPIITVRPFSVYGPNEYRPKIIPTIIEAAITGKTFKLYSGVHDWVYIDDFVDAIIELTTKVKHLHGQVFNVGTGIETDNETLVRLVSIALKKKINIHKMKVPYRCYDTNHWVADISKLRSTINWHPRLVIEGINEIIQTFNGINRSGLSEFK